MRIVTGLLLICLAMLVAVGGLMLVQRLMPTRPRLRHNDVAGFIFAVLGVAYAVLLGLVVVAVWEEWNAAIEAVDQEAGEVAEVYWLAHRLPEPEGSHLQELARSYARTVLKEEWPLMERGKVSPKAWAILDEIRYSIQRMEPATETQQVSTNKDCSKCTTWQTPGETFARRRARLARNPVGDVVRWSGRRGGLHLPLRHAEHYGAYGNGRIVDVGHSVGDLHRWCSGLPVQGRHTYRSGCLRTGAREVLEQQAQRPLRTKGWCGLSASIMDVYQRHPQKRFP